MRWLRFTANQQTSWGIVEGDRVIAVSGDPLGEWQRTPRSHVLADVKIELPLVPRTFYCVGLISQTPQGSGGQAWRSAQRP
jgi:hypothetical protein